VSPACPNCGKPFALGLDWRNYAHGGGNHLCWGPEGCASDADPALKAKVATHHLIAASELYLTLWDRLSETECEVTRLRTFLERIFVGLGDRRDLAAEALGYKMLPAAQMAESPDSNAEQADDNRSKPKRRLWRH